MYMAVDSARPNADRKYPETDNGVGVGRAPGVLRPGPQFQTRQAEQRAPGTAASFGVLISDSHSSGQILYSVAMSGESHCW